MKEFTLIKGALPGPTSVIMAGVHGNEYCGIKAIEKVLPILENKIVRGQVIFLLGNPLAVEENKRFIDSNLNRMFKNTRSKYEAHSYEYHRAKFIMSVLDNADALLDLHSTRNPISPYAFIERINESNQLVVKNLPVEVSKVVLAAADFHPGCSDGYMYQNGKIGICVECGQHEDPRSINIAKNSIFTFLSSLGHFEVSPRFRNYEKEIFCFSEIYFTKTDFKPIKVFPDFTYVKKGTIIGKDGEEKVKAKKNGYVLFVVSRDNSQEEAFVFADKIY
jgi:succinylglutamate desuccinylase